MPSRFRILLLSCAVGFAYKKQYSIVSHGILGILATTAVMILPYREGSLSAGITNILLFLGGAVISFGLSCVVIKDKKAEKEALSFKYVDDRLLVMP